VTGEKVIMQARLTNPAVIIPDAMQAIVTLKRVTEKSGLSPTIEGLTHLRASEINGCSVCVDASVGAC
jgi:alkylhydroperoxidase family enzyme